jgi:hypothetical protein
MCRSNNKRQSFIKPLTMSALPVGSLISAACYQLDLYKVVQKRRESLGAFLTFTVLSINGVLL